MEGVLLATCDIDFVDSALVSSYRIVFIWGCVSSAEVFEDGVWCKKFERVENLSMSAGERNLIEENELEAFDRSYPVARVLAY